MDREEARRRAEIMIAFANGSDVQYYNEVTKQWEDIRPECVLFEPATEYRVKPESKYRPFKTQEECWEEMHKHPDFGWLKSKATGYIRAIGSISNGRTGEILITWSTNEICNNKANNIFNNYEFTDGEPFGIKEK